MSYEDFKPSYILSLVLAFASIQCATIIMYIHVFEFDILFRRVGGCGGWAGVYILPNAPPNGME